MRIMINGAEFNRNLTNHTLEELAPYEGQYVAWSKDGKRILLAAPTRDALYDLIQQQELREYVAGYVPPFDVSFVCSERTALT
jgi:hypothetical protein